MKKICAVSTLAFLLAACASDPTDEDAAETTTATPRPFVAKPVVTLALEQLADYWVIGDALKGGEKPRYKRTIEYGCVRVGFGIDSEARLFDVRVLKSNPQARFSDDAIVRVKALEPEATEMNSEKQPMRSEVILTFANADGVLSLVDNEAIAKLCR